MCSSVVARKGSTKPELGQRGRMRAVTAASAQRIHRDCYTVGSDLCISICTARTAGAQQRASGQQMLHIIITKADGHEVGNRFLELVIFITTICPLRPRRKPRTSKNLRSIIMAFIEPDTTFQIQLPCPCHSDRGQRGHKARSGVKNKGPRQLWSRCLSHMGQVTDAWIIMYIYWQALGQGFRLIPSSSFEPKNNYWIELK